MSTYDLAIIGSGPGGYVTAIRAAQWGMKTVVIEKDGFLGGTCLHVGCIPTKVLLYHAEVYDHIKNAKEYGIEVKDFKLDWNAVLARKTKIVNKHAKGIELLFRKNKVETVTGWGRYAGPGRVTVEKDGKTTDGVEFASIFNSFGTDVTILEMLPRVVPLEDEEISAQLVKAFTKKGIKIQTGAKVQGVATDAKGASVAFTDAGGKAQKISAEKVLIAVGRLPKTENLGLEKTKAKLERGFIHVGPYMETDEPGLYAIGDIVAGMPQLAHAASMEGITAVAKITGKEVPPLEKSRIPNATYCEPQIGSVGLTEKAARDSGYKVKIGKFPFLANSKASILGQHDGFIKVVSEETYGEILGVHIIGPYATEIIAEAVTALQLEATVDDMMYMVHAHPTVWEAMGDAFNSVRGLSINM